MTTSKGYLELRDLNLVSDVTNTLIVLSVFEITFQSIRDADCFLVLE